MMRFFSSPLLAFAYCATVAAAAAEPPVSFTRDVRPILAQRCQVCHQERNSSGGLSLSNYAALLKGARGGPVITPGNPTTSPLIASITGDKPRMPKAGPPLTTEQVALIRRWIAEGAKDDSTANGAAAGDSTWWSLRPLKRPSIPSSEHANPIDAFILAKLKEHTLTPSPEADRRTLIRRVSLDLHGLLPSPTDVNAFLNDRAPGAYERLVDRLLASPRYGERWARHWLDVAHYGDSHGYDKDKPRLNAWPYRDYVIRALNADKSYTRFVQEQLAGDVLFPDDPDGVVATGFIAAGPWDFVGHQELREGTTDKNITRLLDRDDMVAATMSTFVSQTVHCARCHDHKFDPIRQEDYYSVQAVFAGVDRADRPYDTDPATGRQRRALLEQRRQLQIRLQPLLDKVDNASGDEIDKLDFRIKDARLQMAHIGEPKTPADAALKQQLQTQWEADTKRRKQLVEEQVGTAALAEIARLTAESKTLDAALAALPKPSLVYAAANYFPRAGTFRPSLEPRPVHLLDRGNVNAPLQPVGAGAIGVRFPLTDPAQEGARRAALANWIVEPGNGLTWRSIVNRVWHYHFGSGIVDSPSDFGRMGSQPTHPELLDWLAVWFRDDAAGSLKKLHRLIVTSAAYRQTSRERADGAKIDADNRYLWRMNRTRLDAESLRDTMLLVSGKLDDRMGGPAARLFFFKDDHSPVYDYARFDVDSPDGYRRSIYRFIVRSVPDPFMERLDCPDPSLLTAKRSTTLTAIQALALLNNPFVVRMAEHLAARVSASGSDLRRQITEAYQLALNRDPSPAELTAMSAYAGRHGMANVCRLLFNSNEFVFVD
jgi:mono/diheme cytochrome c family protein